MKRCRFADVGMGVFANNDPWHLTGWTGPFWAQFEYVEGQEYPPVMKSYTAIRLYGAGHVVAQAPGTGRT